MYQSTQDPDLAEGILQHAIELEPEDPWAYWYLGEIYRWSGNTDAAKRMYEQVLKLDPNREDARERLSQVGD